MATLSKRPRCHPKLEIQQTNLAMERHKLAKDNRLRQRIGDFARRVLDGFDGLDFEQRQRLLRLVVEEVRVKGWQVEIRVRIPLDDGPDDDPRGTRPSRPSGPDLSTDMGLRSLHRDDLAVMQKPGEDRCGEHVIAEHLAHLTWRWYLFF